MQFLLRIVLVVLFYFMLIRPQMKRNREHRDMLGQMAKGEEVITAGGIAGKVVNITDAYITVEIADNVAVKVQKASITSVSAQGHPESAFDRRCSLPYAGGAPRVEF